MPVTVRKYNPGFLSDDELVESFCVRTAEFESIIESLGDSDGRSSSHTIVIGPRGSGKTHLLLRVAAEMRREDRVGGYFPITFSEESYEVSTHGEFWLECLGRLAEQAPLDERSGLRLTYKELRTVRDDGILAERCLGSILDFSDRHGKRLALVVENLNMLLPDMADSGIGWKLRRTLQTEPRITLLGSATSRFEEIDHPDQPLYDIFRAIALRPLNTEECGILWSSVSGHPSQEGTIRPLEILTGGSPRMIAVVARFRTTHSFNELMNNLLDLIDDHTEYFKSHIDALPPQERRVYLTLARLWKPATTREVADRARINTSKCSAFLRRLVERGAVTEEGGVPRRRQYYLTERLYNIYYLLRSPSGEGQAVRALIQFMSCCYSPGQMLDFGVRIAQEHQAGNTQLRQLQRLAFSSLLELPEMEDIQEDLLTDTVVISQFGSDETPVLAERIVRELINQATSLSAEGQHEEAISDYDQITRRFGQSRLPNIAMYVALSFVRKGKLLSESSRSDDAIVAYDQAINTFGDWKDYYVATAVDAALAMKARELVAVDYRLSEAVEVLENGLVGRFNRRVTPSGAFGLLMLSIGLSANGDLDGALSQVDRVLANRKSIEKDVRPDVTVSALVLKAGHLSKLDRAISEKEVETMLKYLAVLEDLPSEAIDTLVTFSVIVGPSRALELIQESPAVQSLLPLVVALQQEEGAQPRVAREVQEVARDIRIKIAERRDQKT